MPASKQIAFADRLVGASVQNGLVRLDLAVFAGMSKDKEGKPLQRMEITQQLVLPIDAFVQAVGMQQKLLKELGARSNEMAAARKTKSDSAQAPKADTKA